MAPHHEGRPSGRDKSRPREQGDTKDTVRVHELEFTPTKDGVLKLLNRHTPYHDNG